jgi:signal transduction histidine kinase/plasmid maintenance system antidote protein VapI
MKLTKAKQKLLDEAYNTVIQVCLFDRPLEEMTPLLAEDVMNFGAGKNELTKSKAAFLKQIKNQKKLAEGLKMDFAFTPVLRKVMNQGNGAIYTDDIVNTVWVNQIKNELKFRISFIFEYRDGLWLLIHSHTSTPDPQRTDDEVWPIEDLKKRTEFLEKSLEEKMAELQDKNRELEVEAALERVRSKTMAMHNSGDLENIVISLFDEVMKLGLDKSLRCGIGILEGHEGMETRSVNSKSDGTLELRVGMLNMTIHPMLVGLKKAWKKGSKRYSYNYSTEDVRKYYEALNNEPEYPFNANLEKLPEREYHQSFFYSSGILFAFAENPISKEAAKVLNRFAKVFGQTYRRYLDLQKAEEQAREATIESALERVRASSMAMHRSEQLPETSQVLFEQFALLGNLPDRISICIIKEEENLIELWATDQIGSQLDHRYWGSLEEATTMSKVHKAWKEGKDSIVIDLAGQRLKDWLRYIKEDVKLPIDDSNIKGRRVQQGAFFSKGLLLCTTNEPVADETMELLIRFARVFDQTYTRFLDLQKAESQAQEARIEAALERVRAASMAMHKTDELAQVVMVLFQQFSELELDFYQVWINIFIIEEGYSNCWFSPVEGVIDEAYTARVPLAPFEESSIKSWRAGEEFSYLSWKGLKEVDEIAKSLSEMTGHDSFIRIQKKKRMDRMEIVDSNHKYGVLAMAKNTDITDNDRTILKRFSKVFEQTYTRFLDLQNAESQAREATKQASLDRVRGQIASMRTAADLERITPLVWHELTTLGIPFIRCGVFIIDESSKHMQVHLSAPDGHSLGVMELPFDADQLTANSVAYWQRGEVFKGHWNKEQFIDFMQTMEDLGQINNKKVYQGAEQPPESLHLHFLPFTQGMLYVGNVEPLAEDQIESVQSLADAFAIAYARYEDFTNLEKAKRSVETTLTELKTTQSQLVQSEKMASLGELTAGIAHEIQNPLNFVNNFSEVSVELIEEMHEELEKGDLEEARALADDVKQNLDKITHHGKRADVIVKGMLQHSRSSSGVKEPTDINELADEYLRLAYHGLRAKDKSFNATMETDFDEGIGKINIVPQDIGRVILNLITNAFYAVSERKKQQPNEFEPTVSVCTIKKGEHVLISVKDNGNGIPKKVLDKIFQPFFTTKPTGQGTGLGLSLSYDIINAHGGELNVKTKENEGAEFTIMLPV